uniref:Putative ovule protein n=1 Tax=Solanum chacoense TaxID=4108 RepID=A0A0V0HKU0_SOLCH
MERKKYRERGKGKGSSELRWSELWVEGCGRLTGGFGVSFGGYFLENKRGFCGFGCWRSGSAIVVAGCFRFSLWRWWRNDGPLLFVHWLCG